MSFLCVDHTINEISVDDKFQQQRSFLYGDGHFTTAKVINGEIQYLSAHINRLKQANQRLRFNDIDFSSLKTKLSDCVSSLELGFIKVHISRGQSGRGYGQTQKIQPNVFISFGELTAPFTKNSIQPSPIALTVLSTQLAIQPLLAGIKHCNRLEQVLASAELEQSQFSDGLVADTQGNIIESTKANVIWCEQGKWYTPSLHNSGVLGVMLQQVIKNSNALAEVTVINEVRAQLTDVIKNAQAMLICNSLIGLQAVSEIDGRILNTKISDQFMQSVLTQ